LPIGSFRIQRLASQTAGEAHYLAELGTTCRFEIRIGEGTPGGDNQFDFSFAPAAISRRPETDCTGFLHDLAPELGFAGKLPAPQTVERLEESVVILGKNQSRAEENAQIAGAFVAEPPGAWMAMKLFLAAGEGEVFLNLNEQDGVGEFSLKDEEYGEIVVTELARVLLPQRLTGREDG
jgi:hypothetical protein